MVGPLGEADRRAGGRLLGVAFVSVVALSAGLVALYGGASIEEVGLIVVAGAGVGFVLLYLLVGWHT